MAYIEERHHEKRVWVSVPVRKLQQVLDLAEQEDVGGGVVEQGDAKREAQVRDLYFQVSPKTREMMDYLADRPGEFARGIEVARGMGLGSTNAQMNSYNSARDRLGISPEVIESRKLTQGQWWFRVGARDAATIRSASGSDPIVEEQGA